MRPFASGLAAFFFVLAQGAIAQAAIPDSYLARLKLAEAATASLPPAAFGQPGDPALDKLVLAHRSPLQQLGTARSVVGDTDGAQLAFDALHRREPRHPPAVVRQMASLENAAAEDAIAAIVRGRRARNASC